MANTNAKRKLFICVTPQADDLDATEFAALTWVEIKGIGSVGQTGPQTNLLNYPTWDTTVTQKAKGLTDAGSPPVECARIATDVGQIAMRNAAATNVNYAFKLQGNDYPDADPESTPTIIYNRGLVVGPIRPNGRNEDFDLETFTLGLQQLEVVVDPVAAGD